MAENLVHPKRVLILFTARQNLPVNVQWERGIRSGLRQSFPSAVVFDCEYIDFDRFQGQEFREQWLFLMRAKYSMDPPDVVIPVYDLATIYFVNLQSELFPDADVVFCSISEDTLSGLSLTPRMTGVIYRLEFKKTLEIARKLLPEASNVILVSGSGEMEMSLVKACQSQFSDQDDIRFTYWTGIPLDEVCSRAAQLGSESIILFLAFESDRNGKSSVSTRDALLSLTQSANVPVFGLYDSLMGAGVVGGHMAAVEDQGFRAGTIAGRLLQGENAKDIGFSGAEMNRPMFDWRALQRWRIDEKNLPEGAITHFQTPTLWSRFWPYIILIGTILGGQFSLILALLVNRRKRQRAQVELQEMLQFQRVLSEISAILLQHGSGDLNLGLDDAFNHFVELVGLQHWNLLYFASEQRGYLSQISSAKAAGLDEQPLLSVDKISGLWKKVQHVELLTISSVSEWKALGDCVPNFQLQRELNSGIVLPLRDNRQTIGLIIFGIDGPQTLWEKTCLVRMRFFGDLISQYLARAKAIRGIEDSRFQARRLAGQLLTAQEDERKRISRKIHDDVCQRLVAAGIQAGTIERQILGPESVLFSLSGLKDSLISLSSDVQRISRKLHPAILDELGLADAIRSECSRLAESGLLEVDFRCQPLPEKIENRAALCLYRIAQESLWNVVKHSGINQASIRLYSDAESLYMEVADQGRGIDFNQTESDAGLGLVSFKERVRLLGGKIEICSAPDQGTKILVTLPIAEEES